MATKKNMKKPMTGSRNIGGVQIRRADLPANHPFNNRKNNDKLVQHIKDRLDFANEVRLPLVNRMRRIDIEYAGFQKFDDDDKKRDADTMKGDVKVTKVSLELTKTQIEEACTYLLGVFAPDNAMFEAVAPKAKQNQAVAFMTKLNQDAEDQQYYRQYDKAFKNMLKYNIGGWLSYWHERSGLKVMNANQAGGIDLQKKVVWAGNCVKSVNPYNLLWDISVHPCDVTDKGEFFALVNVHRKFRIKKMEADQDIWGTDRFIGREVATCYYQQAPIIRFDDSAGVDFGSTDWVHWMSAGSKAEITSGVEEVMYYGWIIPSDFGLSDSKEMEIWYIVMMADAFIVAASKLENSHGLLPISLATPMEDELGLQNKSIAETLNPLQRFGSHLINTHILGSRKSLYGTTIYDPMYLSFGELQEGNVAPRIALKPGATAGGRKIQDFFMQNFDIPKTENTMDDLAKVLELMQRMLPTNNNQQVADMERATRYQAASLIQGSNKRNQKIAKLIDAMAMKNMRTILMQNILLKQEALTMFDDTGNEIKLNPIELRETDIRFAISEGLKGIDKIQIIELFKEIMSWIIQNAEATKEFDIVALVDYITSLWGDKTDMSQFRRKTIFNQLPPEAQQAVEQALQNGDLNGIIQKYVTQQQQTQEAAAQGQNVPLTNGATAGGY